jgi:hypothetical protein
MFEYHGWAVIQASAGDEEPSDAQTSYDRVAELVESTAEWPGLTSLQWINGNLQFHAGGLLNHRGQQGQEVVDIFHSIGKLAPGSYGLLYVHDDEDPAADDGFLAYVMRRGQVSEERDQFLSPRAPTIEDE